METTSCNNSVFIVMPVYNEQDCITNVVKNWLNIVNKVGNKSKFLVIDDGSTDDTYKKLLALQNKEKRLIILKQKNSGHGQTIFNAYKLAIKHEPNFIFQTDSDNQTNPDEFWNFWKLRNKYDCLIGYRKGRKDGISRKVVTKTLRVLLLLIFKTYIKDANAPFRLMNKKILKKALRIIPKNYNLTNVALSVYFKKKQANIKFIKISFQNRKTGVNSINLPKIIKIGLKALKDFRIIKKRVKCLD